MRSREEIKAQLMKMKITRIQPKTVEKPKMISNPDDSNGEKREAFRESPGYEHFITREYRYIQQQKEEKKKTAGWYQNCKLLATYRKKLDAAHRYASDVDAEQLLNATAGVRYQYECLMDRWRHAQAILDLQTCIPVKNARIKRWTF